jgi:large subunit ribosomal protein L6
MSRIGKLPITLPGNVSVTYTDNVVKVKGPKGELVQNINPKVILTIEDSTVSLTRENDEKESRALHGLYRSLIFNMVKGVSEGYKTEQELVGVGYRAEVQGQILKLSLGYSHDIVLELPSEIKATAVTERGKNPLLTLECIDKQLIGQVAAKIRSLRKPEPYKGKGVKFVGEQIRRKAGKSAGKK